MRDLQRFIFSGGIMHRVTGLCRGSVCCGSIRKVTVVCCGTEGGVIIGGHVSSTIVMRYGSACWACCGSSEVGLGCCVSGKKTVVIRCGSNGRKTCVVRYGSGGIVVCHYGLVIGGRRVCVGHCGSGGFVGCHYGRIRVVCCVSRVGIVVVVGVVCCVSRVGIVVVVGCSSV